MKEELIATGEINNGISTLYHLLSQAVSQDWKTFSITIDGKHFELDATTPEASRDEAIKLLLKDALCAHINRIGDDDYSSPFNAISMILNGARKEDHQFELIKEDIVSNIDESGNPITAKPLNEDSVYVQWQNENKFHTKDFFQLKDFDEYAKNRLTDEEIESIDKEAKEDYEKIAS